MLSHSPAILRFDPRLTPNFYEAPEHTDQPEPFHNMGKIRKEAIYLLFVNSMATSLNDLSLQRKFANYLLNAFSSFFHFGMSKDFNIHSEEFRQQLEQAKNGKVLYLKQNLTLEFVLYFILAKKIDFQAKISDTKLTLSKTLDKLYEDLDSYGADPEFIKFINFKYTHTTGTQYLYDDNPQVDVLQELGTELHSSLMISLMRRLANRGYISFEGMQVEKVSATAVSFVLPGCKTITLMYVVEDKLRKPLISYLKETGRKDCSNIISNFELLTELLNSFPLDARLTMVRRSFNDDYLLKVIRNIADLTSLLGLFTYEDQDRIRILFAGKRFIRRDPAFSSSFYTAVPDPVDNKIYNLATWLMEARRTILTRKLTGLINSADHRELPEIRDLEKVILNYFSGEVGLNPGYAFQSSLIQNKAIKKIVVEFSQLIPKLLSLTNIVDYIYTTRIKPLLNEFVKNVTAADNTKNKLTEKLDFFGEDDLFSTVNLFEEEKAMDGIMQPLADKEVEVRLLITLVHRLAYSQFIDLSSRAAIQIDEDEIYYFPTSGMNFASVNMEREPLTNFLLKKSNSQLNELFRAHPMLTDVIDQFPRDRQKILYQVNCRCLHLFVLNFQKLYSVLEKFSQDEREIFFKHVKTEMLSKVLEDTQQYEFFVNFVPKVSSFLHLLNKIPIAQFEKIHSSHTKFICFMRFIPDECQSSFVERLDADYLQNIHPTTESFCETYQSISVSAISILYTKLGDNYFQILFPNVNRFIFLLKFGNEIKTVNLCRMVAPEHLREILNTDSAVTAVLNMAPNHQTDLTIEFINKSCPAYQKLFQDQSFFAATLKIMQGNELYFVQQLTINFVPSPVSRDHLFEILIQFSESKARLEFCLKMQTGLVVFIRTSADFLVLLELLAEPDRLVLLTKTFDFLLSRLIRAPEDTIPFFNCLPASSRPEFYEFLANSMLLRQLLDEREKFVAFTKMLSFEFKRLFHPYIKIIESFEEAKYSRLEDILNGIWTDLSGANTSYVMSGHKTHAHDFNILKSKFRLQLDKIDLVSDKPIPDKLARAEDAFALVLVMFEKALSDQFSQSCNRWFSSKSIPQLINDLNKPPFNHHHYTRMLGLILNNLYVSYPDVIATNNNPDRDMLMKLVATIKKPMAYRNYLFKMSVGEDEEDEEEIIAVWEEEAKRRMSR